MSCVGGFKAVNGAVGCGKGRVAGLAKVPGLATKRFPWVSNESPLGASTAPRNVVGPPPVWTPLKLVTATPAFGFAAPVFVRGPWKTRTELLPELLT